MTQMGDQFADHLGHRAQPRIVDIDKGNCPTGLAGRAQDVVEDARRKPAPGTGHGDFNGTGKCAGQAPILSVLSMGGVTHRCGPFRLDFLSGHDDKWIGGLKCD